MNYRTIIEEAADRAARHKQSVYRRVWDLGRRLEFFHRVKRFNYIWIFSDGKILDVGDLQNGYIRWL